MGKVSNTDIRSIIFIYTNIYVYAWTKELGGGGGLFYNISWTLFSSCYNDIRFWLTILIKDLSNFITITNILSWDKTRLRLSMSYYITGIDQCIIFFPWPSNLAKNKTKPQFRFDKRIINSRESLIANSSFRENNATFGFRENFITRK